MAVGPSASGRVEGVESLEIRERLPGALQARLLRLVPPAWSALPEPVLRKADPGPSCGHRGIVTAALRSADPGPAAPEMRLQALHHIRGQGRVGAPPATTLDDKPPLVVLRSSATILRVAAPPAVAAPRSARIPRSVAVLRRSAVPRSATASAALVSVVAHGRRAYAACELPCPGMASMSFRVYGSCGFMRMSPVFPSSTSTPSFMTATRSEICATTARSCVMNR